MKFLRYGVIGAILLATLFFIVGLFLPSSSHVERSIVINASPDNVFSLINNFREFNKWSPWAAKDLQAVYHFEGPESGVGAKMKWLSKNPRVGSGMNTIIVSEINQRVETKLEFAGDIDAKSSLVLMPEDDGVRLTWSFDVQHGINPMRRFYGLKMDEMLGPDYETGLASLRTLAEAMPKILTQELSYDIDGNTFKGYLAQPEGEGKHPAILIVHEWWGHNNYARRRARQLAELGYTAFALDMYGAGKVAEHPQDATKFMNEVIMQEGAAKARFDAALALLKQQSSVDTNKIAAIGYCFGGGVVLSMARLGGDLRGVVSFHGALGKLPPIAESGVKAKVLVLNGSDDPFITAAQKQTFKQEMDEAKADYEFIDYPGVKHSFTNSDADKFAEKFNMPLKYDAEADADSWQRMKVFFEAIFQ